MLNPKIYNYYTYTYLRSCMVVCPPKRVAHENVRESQLSCRVLSGQTSPGGSRRTGYSEERERSVSVEWEWQLQQRRLAVQGLSRLLSFPYFPYSELCVRVRVGSRVYELAQKLQLELKLQVDRVFAPSLR